MISVLPIIYMVRAVHKFKEDRAQGIPVIKDKQYLRLQITFQWYAICLNVAIAVVLGFMTIKALRTLRYFFASQMES